MIDREALIARIQTAFPDADLSSAVVNTDGMVNTAVIAGSHVYRFARNEWSIRALDSEIAALDLVRRVVDLPIPHFTRVAADFVHYPFLPGEPLTRNMFFRLPAVDQAAVCAQLARFLRQMHAIPVDDVHAAGIGSSGGRQSAEEWIGLYEAAERELFPLMYRITRDHIRDHFAPLLQNPAWLDFEPALIHDDLAQYHILFNPDERRISGVIDFGTAGLGDPARDYGILINVYGESVVRQMAEYDDRIPALIDRARFFAGTAELQWLLIGYRTKDFEIMTAHLDRARDVMPYGTALLARQST